MSTEHMGNAFQQANANRPRSLNLPIEAHCKHCGFFDITHPEVISKLKGAGWTLDEAKAYAECQCGTEEEKKAAFEGRKRAALAAGKLAKRSDFATEHAKGFSEADAARERKRYR